MGKETVGDRVGEWTPQDVKWKLFIAGIVTSTFLVTIGFNVISESPIAKKMLNFKNDIYQDNMQSLVSKIKKSVKENWKYKGNDFILEPNNNGVYLTITNPSMAFMLNGIKKDGDSYLITPKNIENVTKTITSNVSPRQSLIERTFGIQFDRGVLELNEGLDVADKISEESANVSFEKESNTKNSYEEDFEFDDPVEFEEPKVKQDDSYQPNFDNPTEVQEEEQRPEEVVQNTKENMKEKVKNHINNIFRHKTSLRSQTDKAVAKSKKIYKEIDSVEFEEEDSWNNDDFNNDDFNNDDEFNNFHKWGGE